MRLEQELHIVIVMSIASFKMLSVYNERTSSC